MKNIILILLFVILIFIVGCAQQKELPSPPEQEEVQPILNLPEHCKDNKYNQGEQGLDCGWSCPNECNFVEKCGEITTDETWNDPKIYQMEILDDSLE